MIVMITLCLLLQTSVHVHLNRMQSQKTMGVYTGERLSTGAEERVVNLLSQGEPVSRIAKRCRMSVHSVMAIRERRSQAIADRKQMIAA
jgi:hypothetical protein